MRGTPAVPTSSWPPEPQTDGPKLDPDALATYHERGFVVAPGVFSAEEIAAINGEIDRLQAANPHAFAESGLFHADLWHRSLGNRSDRPRRSFIVSYQEATATRGNGAQHKILRPA